jgi:hypothetical protein
MVRTEKSSDEYSRYNFTDRGLIDPSTGIVQSLFLAFDHARLSHRSPFIFGFTVSYLNSMKEEAIPRFSH